MADTIETQGKSRDADAGQSRIDVIHLATIEIAEKSECDVEIFRRDPARSRDAATQQTQLPADCLRHSQGDEQAHGALSWSKGATRGPRLVQSYQADDRHARNLLGLTKFRSDRV